MSSTQDDLKLIDELLCDAKARERLTWAELESHSFITSRSMRRLRQAWTLKEMPTITLGLANYFLEQKHDDAAPVDTIPDATCPKCGWYLETNEGRYIQGRDAELVRRRVMKQESAERST